jgi:hypothetical protein
LFERTGGLLPSVLAIDDRALEDSSFEYPEKQEMLMISEYKRILRSELDTLTEQQRRMDILLLLLPSETCNERRWLIAALAHLDLEYIDYTVEHNRRFLARPQQIRICTFLSSRGIEGMKVMIFGLDKLPRILRDMPTVSKGNVGYITLSRSCLNESIVKRASLNSDEYTFTEAVLNGLSSNSH